MLGHFSSYTVELNLPLNRLGIVIGFADDRNGIFSVLNYAVLVYTPAITTFKRQFNSYSTGDVL